MAVAYERADTLAGIAREVQEFHAESAATIPHVSDEYGA